MLRFFFFCFLVLSLASCQKAVVRYKVVENLSPDRGQFLTAPKASHTPGIISGQVLSLIDDSAIEGAVVTIMKGSKVITTAVTDSKGFFKIVGLPQSTYRVTAEKKDYSVLSFESVSLVSGKEVITHFILTPVATAEDIRLS